MTEAAFQEGRKVMQKANYLRGIITKWEGEVAKWTRIEGSHRENLRYGQADGAKKMIEKSIKRLEEVRQKFADMTFPPHDIVAPVNRCKDCGRKIQADEECLCYAE